MKQLVSILLVLMCAMINAQQNDTASIVNELQSKVRQSVKGEKLKWLDSLSTITHRNPEFKFDSIVKESITLAQELDSVNSLVKFNSLLINHYNNRLGKADKGREVHLEMASYVNRVTEPEILAKFFIESGDSYYFLRDYPTSIELYEKAIEISEEAALQRLLGIALMYKGDSQSFAGDFSEASQSLQEASKIFEKSKDTFNIISAKNSLSIIYSQNGFFEQAKKEREEAIVFAKAINSYEHLTSFYFNAATDSQKLGELDSQISYLNLAMEAVRNSGNDSFYEPMFYANLVSAHALKGNIELAEEYLAKIEKKKEEYTVGQYKPYYLVALKNLAFAKGNFQEAVKYGKDHLEITKEGTHFEDRQNAEEFMAKAYEAQGNEKMAYSHFKEFYKIKDSISSVQKINGLSYYQTLYETEKRDRTIAAQKSDIAVLDAKNRVKNQWILIGGLGLLSIFGSIFLIRSRNFARKERQFQEDFSQGLIEAQEKERTRLARELHDSVGQKLMLLTKKTKEKNDPSMADLADGTLDELRTIARGLHPAAIEKLGITAALEALINEVDKNSEVFFTHEIDPIDDVLSKEEALHLYRIIQEVLNNMIKHADAKSASIRIDRNSDKIFATVKDNGTGFDVATKTMKATSLGMKTLVERAKILKSKIEITSKPNQGTEVQLIIPT